VWRIAWCRVELDMSKLTLLGEYAVHRAGMLMNHRPDGSFVNWRNTCGARCRGIRRH
jgi:hypothetical protein